MHRRPVGDMGESVAVDFLRRKGFEILERNYLKPWGEIDIVGVKGGIVRFLEVKTISRENSAVPMHHQPEDLVDRRKLAKLARTAQLYMEEKGDTREYQIDVVGVVLSHKTRTARCRLLEQAL